MPLNGEQTNALVEKAQDERLMEVRAHVRHMLQKLITSQFTARDSVPASADDVATTESGSPTSDAFKSDKQLP
jgi:hypothetical protein